MPSTGQVSLIIYDLNGRLVKLIHNGDLNPGKYKTTVDLTNEPAGLYLISLETQFGNSVRKAMLIK